jgi:hypothetical protein
VDPSTASVEFVCEDCKFATADDRLLSPSPLHYQSLPPKMNDLGDVSDALRAVARARQRLKRAVGLHPAEANLLAVQAGLGGEDEGLAARLRQRFYGRYWRDADAARVESFWKIKRRDAARNGGTTKGSQARDAMSRMDPFLVPELGIDGPDQAESADDLSTADSEAVQSASHKLVARALQLIANGKDAAIACEELDQLPETQVWARVRDLQALVGEAREERKMLDSLAKALQAKKAEVDRTIAEQEEYKRLLRERNRSETTPGDKAGQPGAAPRKR